MGTLKAYRNKTVLVTGDSGFKGSWLSAWLSLLGAKVVGYSLDPPTVPSMFKAIHLEEKVTHILGDIRDQPKLLSVFKEFQPEYVFHLAAQPLVRLSYEEPYLTYETNVMGTVNVLESIRKTSCVKSAIIVTSDKCYENNEWVFGYREIDAVGGYDPYSSSKGCAELVVSAYRRSFFGSDGKRPIAVATVRAGNVIGGGDWGLDRLVPDCIKALSEGKDAVIRNPLAIRPWQYVLDPLHGYLLLGLRLYENDANCIGAWNFGPTDIGMITVEEMAKKILAEWGHGKYRVEKSGSIVHEATLLRLDCSKAHSILGWKAEYSVDEAIKQTVAWYKLFYSRPDQSMSEFTIGQIKEYEIMLQNRLIKNRF